MNKLEQDILNRVNEKLACLMEKRAFTLPPEMRRNMANSAIANALVGGGLGALAGMGGTYISSKISDYDPSWMDYLSTGLEDGLIAGAISGLAGGITGAGELPKMNVAGMKISSYNMEKDANLNSIVSEVAKGTAQGALNALIGTVAGNGLGAITESLVSSDEDSTGALPAVGGLLGGYALPIARDLTSIGSRSIPYHIGDLLGTIGANQMLQNSALANYSINNPEQLEEDPKLASLHEKTAAGIGDFVKRTISSPGYRKYLQTRLGQDIGGAVTGAGAGALVGGLGNAARGLMFDKVDPKDDGFFNRIGKGISDFGTGAFYGGLAGGVGGAYKAHSNISNMINKRNDALNAGIKSNYDAKTLQNTLDAMRNNGIDLHGGFGSGFWSGMNTVGDSLAFRNPVSNFLSDYNNNPNMNKKWNTPVPQTPAPAAS